MGQKIKYEIIDGCKYCPGCDRILPVNSFHKDKNHFTAKCKDCTRAYAKEYRIRPENIIKRHKYHKEYKSRPGNRDKINKRASDWRKTTKGKESRNKLRRLWTLREKLKAIEYKGGKCTVCGYNKCTAAMEFHHLNPNEKEGIKDHLSFENTKKELDKCVLLCCRCHRELHAGLLNL